MPKTFRIIALSLVGLALLLAIIAIGLGKRAPAPAANTESAVTGNAPVSIKQTMVVAARNLPAGKAVSLGDLKSVEVPQLPPGATSSLYEFDNAIPARDIPADTTLHPALFLGGLSSQLAAGERAIAVAVDEISGVGNHIVPGDFVDVFVALPESRTGLNNDHKPAATRMIASRLRVLTYGQQSLVSDQTAAAAAPATTEADSSGQDSRAQAITARSQHSATGNGARTQASSAVLAVPPDQAGSLLLGAQEGQLFLALRNPVDTSIVDTERFATPGTLLPLAAAAGLSDGRAPPSADDRAYAGITLTGLTGQKTSQPGTRAAAPTAARRPARSTGSSGSGVQIIRGADAPRALTSQ